jgi:hypothetical protein
MAYTGAKNIDVTNDEAGSFHVFSLIRVGSRGKHVKVRSGCDSARDDLLFGIRVVDN